MTLSDDIEAALRTFLGGANTAEERHCRIEAFRAISEFALCSGPTVWAELELRLAKNEDLLFSYAWGGAVQSVCEHDPRWVRMGLVALALEGARMDWRETLVRLSLLAHSTKRIAAPLGELVEHIAGVASPRFTELLRGYFALPSEQQDIRLMGYAESEDEDGFTYKQLEWDE